MSVDRDWEVIVSHSDCNVRVGEHNAPKRLSYKVFDYKVKRYAIIRYAECCAYYESKSYDWKPYSMGASKYFHEQGDKDIMTYVLLHHKGEEYVEMSKDEQELLNLHYEKLAKKIKTNPKDYVLG